MALNTTNEIKRQDATVNIGCSRRKWFCRRKVIGGLSTSSRFGVAYPIDVSSRCLKKKYVNQRKESHLHAKVNYNRKATAHQRQLHMKGNCTPKVSTHHRKCGFSASSALASQERNISGSTHGARPLLRLRHTDSQIIGPISTRLARARLPRC